MQIANRNAVGIQKAQTKGSCEISKCIAECQQKQESGKEASRTPDRPTMLSGHQKKKK
jgi:hypothetical protein